MNESEFDRELYTARWELQLNQARLNDVRDAMKAATREWDELQAERRGILSKIVEIEGVHE
jgi:hypothetical protein